jgi:hypothetical protein
MTVRTIIGANAVIKWGHDDPETENVYISFGREVADIDGFIYGDTFGVNDYRIFFYGSPSDEENYREGHEDWVLVDWEFVYRDEA